MKKILLLATIVGTTSLLQATTITAPSSLIGTGVMLGGNAYSWGISIAVPSGQQVATAEIDFSNVKLTVGDAFGQGTLFTDLLNSKSTGVNVVADNLSTVTDYWPTKFSGSNIQQLGSEFFASVGTTLSWNYILNSAQLAALNSYLSANGGLFNIGFDPDCHYNIGNLTFSYTLTTHNTVPDVATTASLLVLALAGLEVFRRQIVAAKAKA